MTDTPGKPTLPHAAAALGPVVQARWDAVHNDERALPGIALEVLGRFDPPPFSPVDLGAFVIESSVPQPAAPAARMFSDVPVRVHQGRGFHIMLLTWLNATTSIHQHAFSGAFLVARGSSLHSVYRFDRRRRYSSRLHTGRVECVRMEHLSAGDVHPITSGSDGLAHALYHLDAPSVTVVIRTDTDADAGPQLAFQPPGIAYERPGQDAALSAFEGVLRAFRGSADADALARLLADRIFDLPTERIVDAALGFPDLVVRLARPAGWAALSGRPTRWAGRLADRLGGELAGELVRACGEARRIGALRRLRGSVRDPDLRFFLALMLNGRRRGDVLAAVRTRGGLGDPAGFCARSLLALAGGAAAEAPARGTAEGLPALRAALAKAGDRAPEAAARFAAGGAPDVRTAAAGGTGAVAEAVAALRAHPALRALADTAGRPDGEAGPRADA